MIGAPSAADWDLAWRRLVAACAEARRRVQAGGEAAPSTPAEYPPIAPRPTPTPDRPILRDDVVRLAALSRAYLLTYSSAGDAVTIALLATSRGAGDLAFGVNVLPDAGPIPPGGIGPAIVLEASRALLTAPITRAGRFVPRERGRLAFEAAPGFPPPASAPDGEPLDLPGLVLAAFQHASSA